MNVSIGSRWEKFVDALVETGRYSSASEIMREGLRLVEEREARLQALRETLDTSIEQGGAHGSDDVRSAVGARLDAWEQANRK